jgi:hypothetical protein
MAAGDIISTKRYTNLIETEGEALVAEDDAMIVYAHSSEYTFAINVTGGANFTIALECSFNDSNVWFTIDTSKNINSDGQYAYFYTGKPAAKLRLRVASISSGTPSVTPYIAVAYHG